MVDARANYSRLAEVVSGLGLHEHLCIIYDTPEEQFAAALPYLRAGLERGEKCIYIVDENTAAAVLDALRKGGTDVDRHLRSGALTIANKDETYLQQGRFDPDWMISFMSQTAAAAGAAKFSGWRTLLAEMTWALEASNGTARLIEYESKLNHFFRDHDARGICQYNRTRFSPELLLGVIRTHPLVVYGGIVCKNPSYVPPDEYLKPNQVSQEVERLLHNILTWERTQQALRHGEDHLRLVIDTVPALIHTGRPDGYLDFFNRRWLDYVGLSLAELAGWKWTGVIHPQDVAPMVEEWRAALATGEPFEHEARARRADGEYRWMLHRKVPLRDERGNIVKWYGSSFDVEGRKRAEEALRRSEAYLAAGQRLSHTGSWALNVSSGEIFWSEETYRIFGFDPATTTPSIRETFLPRIHPEDRPRVEDGLKAAGIQKRSYGVDYRIVIPDGPIKYIHDVVYPVVSEAGTVVERYGVIMDVTDRMRAEEALQESRDRLRALSARLQKVREEERTRVAREIHDELGQALTAIKIDLSSLSHNLSAEKKQQSESIMRLVEETIQSVRRISTELRPAILDSVGLVAAIEWALEEFAARTGIKYRLDLPPDDTFVNPDRSTALFRIFQETLTNVARHAKATQVNVRLAKEDSDLTLEVRDNGEGISEENLSAGTSLGILGMRERALLLGGDLTIAGVPAKGTTVKVRIPVTHPTPPRDGK
jgi:PAS domain S-box-containing protein